MILPDNRVGRKTSDPISVCAHLPETLDLAAVTRPAWTQYAAWVVSAVVVRRFLDRDADETTYVPLSADYLNLHIPAPVRSRLLNDLLGAGVLETDNLYYFGPYARGGKGKARCYRLGPTFRGAAIRPHRLTHPELLKKLATAWAVERDEVTDSTHLALRAWHDRVEVLPDTPAGEHLLLDRLIEGERRFTVCPQGRVHTNVANLPAQFRRHIRLAGRELEAVDIANSQPLLLALLLRKMGLHPPKGPARGHSALYDTYWDGGLSDFLDHCLDGTVYGRVAEGTGYTRDEVKSLFLAVIYGRPQHMGTKVGLAIRRLYPAVFDAVTDLNSRLGDGGLPRLMQQVESGVMIGRVAARLVREHPDMPLLTVHDSVLVPAEHVAMVEAVIAEEWTAEFGVAPRTKSSTFTAPQAARVKKGRRKPARRAEVETPTVAA